MAQTKETNRLHKLLFTIKMHRIWQNMDNQFHERETHLSTVNFNDNELHILNLGLKFNRNVIMPNLKKCEP